MPKTKKKQPLGPNQKRAIAALRSGRYKQWRGCLECDGKNCCLGVWSRVFRCKRTVDSEGIIYYDEESHVAPVKVVKALALRTDCTVNEGGDERLMDLNDNYVPFAEIADLIEADPAMYFKEPR